ncbi:MAG: alcohol dehydrogenase catalytic domain-containing protein [Ardenticatenaceae bacterium]|nr:alcohol dehydrogenase catalytic domain-containing protein [Ardenticatenaceae bacterium]
MKTAVLTTKGFAIEETDMPIIGDDEVLLRTLACGVCTGDLFVYKNREVLAANPLRLGHEGSGVVAQTGRAVTGFQVGEVVTSLGGRAYADYFVAKASQLVKLPPEVDPLYALGEAVACCVHAANRFGTRHGDRVAVLGCGFMGLICLQLVKQQGAGFLCAFDPIAERREMARRLGADVVYDPNEVDAKTLGNFEVVIEAAGVQGVVDLGTELVGQHGRFILVGYHQSDNGRRTVNMQQWNFKAIDVINGHVRRMDEKAEAMRQGMELMQQGVLDTKPLVTVYDFADIEQAFQALAGGEEGLYKVVLRVG